MSKEEDKSQLVTKDYLDKRLKISLDKLENKIAMTISESIQHLIDVMPRQIGESLTKKFEEKFVTKDEFNELKEVVYGNSEDIIEIRNIVEKELVIRNKQYDDNLNAHDVRISRLEYSING